MACAKVGCLLVGTRTPDPENSSRCRLCGQQSSEFGDASASSSRGADAVNVSNTFINFGPQQNLSYIFTWRQKNVHSGLFLWALWDTIKR